MEAEQTIQELAKIKQEADDRVEAYRQLLESERRLREKVQKELAIANAYILQLKSNEMTEVE